MFYYIETAFLHFAKEEEYKENIEGLRLKMMVVWMQSIKPKVSWISFVKLTQTIAVLRFWVTAISDGI